jgi:hypothetical protein
MFHAGGKDWTDWNAAMRDFLVKRQDQNKTSANMGSWSPQGDRWGPMGGRLMTTSMSLLVLQVYYRHTPLFARPGKE